MGNLADMEPLITKVKPYFLLVEMTEDPEERERAKAFLGAYLPYLHKRMYLHSGIPLSVGIYPFGVRCCAQSLFPEDLMGFDPCQTEGEETISAGEILSRLYRDLSRTEKLNFSAGIQLPSILLISNCEIERCELNALANNNWFFHGRKAVLTYELLNPGFARAFLGEDSLFRLPSLQMLAEEGIRDPFPEIWCRRHSFTDFTDSLMDLPGGAEEEPCSGETAADGEEI